MKKRLVSVWTKRAITLALSFALITPVSIVDVNNVVAEAYEYSVEVPAPLMEIDFEKGFKGETEDGFEVVSSEPVLYYMCEETPRGENGTNYNYDFTTPLYQGTVADADYKKGATANTPCTEYDDLMGHVIWMHEDFTAPEFIKTKPAAYTNETTGELLTDINNKLDEIYPPYTQELDAEGNETEASLAAKEKATLQKEYTYYPEAKMNNPFATLGDTDTVTVNYWIKLTADADNAAASENTVVLNIKKAGTVQYPAGQDVSKVWPTDQASTIPYGFANGFLQISADGSVIFCEDDGTAIDQNKSSATYGQVVNFNADNNFTIAGTDSVLTDICKPAEWHMVTIQISNDSVKTYYDGNYAGDAEMVSGSAFNTSAGEGVTGASTLIDWLKTVDTVSIGGCNEAKTKALGFDANVTPFCLDDLRFYGEALSAEQIKELYNEGTAKLTVDTEIPEPTVLTFKTAADFSTDIKQNNPSKDKVESPTLVNDTRMGSVLKTFAGKTTETSAAKVAVNPFAGKDLEGATVSYWMKADGKEVNEKSGEVTYNSTVGISFIDTPKEMYHAKMQEATKGTLAFSVLYAKTDGFACFQEGSSDVKVPDTLKNQFSRNVSAEDATKLLTDNDGAWHLYTMVITNKEVKYYVDGVKLDNVSIDKGPRFFDGYYQRMQDFADDNVFYGGSGNAGATALLTFLTYEDTAMYVAYANQAKSSSTYQVCTDAYFGEIECYDVALTDEQVAEVYSKQLEKYPEVTVELGDVNGDTFVTAADALLVLKHAAKLETLAGDQAVAAEVSGDGNIDSADALLILKKAAGLISGF